MSQQCAVIIKETLKQCEKRVVNRGVCADHQSYVTGENGLVGFNLIVKNEEKVLARCLSSIREIADEIVVTDTGSSDNTIPIALEYADKVLYHEWQNSFSEARNFSLQASRARLIGWIDADESIVPDSLPVLQAVIQEAENRNLNTVFCPLHSELSDARVSRHFLPKIFRRGTAHFENIVHNQLIHKNPSTIANVVFWHTGYNLNEEAMARKRKRTSTLLLKQLEENPDDAFAIMNLARCYMTGADYKESLTWCKKGLGLPSAQGSVRQMLLYNLAMCYMADEEFEMVEKTCWEGLELNENNLDLLFVLGWTCTNMGQAAKAIVVLNRYVQVHQEHGTDFNLLITDFWSCFPQLYHFLCVNYRNLGLKEKAVHHAIKAVTENLYNTHLWKQIASDYESMGKSNDVKQTLYGAGYYGVADSQIFHELGRLNNER